MPSPHEPHDPYYASRYACEPARSGVWLEICKYLQRYIPKDGAVLDLGAGTCSFVNQIEAGRKTALDISPGFVRFAGADVQSHVGSCADLSRIPSRSLDAIFASNLLEHLSRETLEATVREVQRTLRPGGLFIALQPNFFYAYRNYFDDPTHRQIFSHTTLMNFLQARSFTIERLEARFLPFSFKSRIPKAAWLVRLYLRLPFRPFAGQMLVIARSAAIRE